LATHSQKGEERIDLVAGTGANVPILGESATGKELLARAIHQREPAPRPPFREGQLRASIPKELFESEFFGHPKGALICSGGRLSTARRLCGPS
jgi:transcriptional regulator with GAF, ATPase, and Fis domain